LIVLPAEQRPHRFCPRLKQRSGLAVQGFGVILAAKDCATIFPFCITNVSVAASYELSAVSALHKM
jgi:hypothetical protein